MGNEAAGLSFQERPPRMAQFPAAPLMNFALAVGRVALLRPHHAVAALYWYSTGKKVRARNRLRLAISQTSSAYRHWMASTERLNEIGDAAPATISAWTKRPLFSIILHVDGTDPASAATATLQSIRSQFYANWELLLASPEGGRLGTGDLGIRCQSFAAADPGKALELGLSLANGDYVIPLGNGDKLSPAALFRYAEALQGDWPAILYGDEDQLNRRGKRTRPWFKPQWNEELFLAQDYISSACAIRKDLGRSVLPLDPQFAPVASYVALLRITSDQTAIVRHVPHILCHRDPAWQRDHQNAYVAATSSHLASKAETSPGPYGSVRVKWPLPDQLSKVSIIVPTRDKVELLRACVEGVLSKTSHPDFELIIVDNGSVEPQTHQYLQELSSDPRVQIVDQPGPYNYSAINNFAVARSRGDFICLLNNDTEVISGDWLTAMMRQATRPHVGAVGAKLLYSDGSIQHAGVVVGLGEAAGHAHRFLRKGQPGYFNLPHLPHYVSAVTAACLLVEKKKFEAVGGLDADRLAIAFNDVDLCLKLGAAGWRNVYEPGAVLIHHESKSRGRDISPQHIARYMRELAVFQERWGTKTYADPLHNPNLNRAHESFTIRI